MLCAVYCGVRAGYCMPSTLCHAVLCAVRCAVRCAVCCVRAPSRGSKATQKPEPSTSTGSGTSSEQAYLHTCCAAATQAARVRCRRGEDPRGGRGSVCLGSCPAGPCVCSDSDPRSACRRAALHARCRRPPPHTHAVAQRLEQQLVGQHIHGQLLVTEAVHAGGAGAAGGADLQRQGQGRAWCEAW